MNTQEEMALAYYKRDVEMNLDFNKTFEHSMNKLGYSPESIEKNTINEYKYYRLNLIDIEKDNLFDKIILAKNFEEFKESIINKTNNNNRRYIELSHFSTDNKRFYENLTIEELAYLGY